MHTTEGVVSQHRCRMRPMRGSPGIATVTVRGWQRPRPRRVGNYHACNKSLEEVRFQLTLPGW